MRSTIDVVLPSLDPSLGVHLAFVSVPREQVIFLKVLLESYEGIAAYRTQDPHHVAGRALVAVMVAPDFVADATAVLREAAESADLTLYEASWRERARLLAALEPNDEPR